jgi:hypothetical protein
MCAGGHHAGYAAGGWQRDHLCRGDTAITNDTALNLEGTVTGTLDATATTGGITDSGILSVSGNATFTDSANAGITLDTLQADGNVIISGGDTAITNDTALNLEGTVTGTLDATATTGGITDSGILSVSGNATFTDSANAGITLDTLQADGNVIISGGDTAITNDTALNLEGTVTGTLDATATTGGITDSGILSVSGNATFTDSANAGITLDTLQADGNVIISGGDTAITNDTALNLEGTVTGTLAATATTGGITDSNTLIVTVSADFNAQAGIVLSDLQATDIAADTAAGDIDIANDAAAATSVTSLTTTGGNISFTQTGAGEVTFTTVSTDGAGSIDLSAQAGMTVDGAVSTAGGDITFDADSDGVATGTGLFTLAATGSINTSGGNLTITGADFDFLTGSSMTVGAGIFDLIFSRPGSLCLGDAVGCQINLSNEDLLVLADTTSDLELDNTGNAILADGADFGINMIDVTLLGSTIDNAAAVTTIGLTNIGTLTMTATGSIGSSQALGVSADTVDVTDALDVTLFNDGGAGDTNYAIGSNSQVGAVNITQSAASMRVNRINANSNVILDAQAGTLNIFGDIDAGDTVQLNGTAGINLTGGDVTTTAGNIVFNDAVTVSADSAVDTSAGGGNIIFTGLVDANAANIWDLTLTAGAGSVDLPLAVGGTIALANFEIVSAAQADLANITANDIAVAATLINLNGTDYIAENGDVTLDGAVVLAGSVSVDSSLADGAILVTGAINGTTADNEALTLDAGAGAVTLQGAVGGATPLASLDITGGAVTVEQAVDVGGLMEVTNSALFTTLSTADIVADGGFTQNGAGSNSLGADITTTDNGINFATAVVLTDSVTMDTGAGAGDITFASTIDGTLADAQALTLAAGTGAVSLQGAVGGTTPLASLDITGGAVTVEQAVDVGGLMEVTNSALFTTLATADIVADGGFTQNGAGSNSLGADITTTDNGINFATAVVLTDSVTMDTGAGAGDITFASTIDGTTADIEALTLAAGTGAVTLEGAVGGSTPLASLDITGGAVTVEQAVDVGGLMEVTNSALFTTLSTADIVADGGFTQNGAGSNSLGADITTTDSNISFATAVVLTDSVIMDTNAGAGDITFASTIDGTAADTQALTLAAGTGAVTLEGAVGGTTPLASLDITGGAVTVEQAVDVGGLMEVTNSALFTTLTTADIVADGGFTQNGAGSNSLGADITTTDNGINFATAVVLTDSVTMDTNAGAGDITFASTIDGTAADTQALTLAAGTGAVTLQGAVGGTTPLASLDITGGAVTVEQAVDVGGLMEVTNSALFTTLTTADIVADGGFTQNGAGSNSLGADITTTDNGINFATAVVLTDSVTMDTNAGAGDITFASTIDGTAPNAQALTLAAGAGNVDLQDAVGGTTPLDSLTINSAINVDLVAVTAGTVTQLAGTGTTTVAGAMNANTGNISITTDRIVQDADMTATGNVLLNAAADIDLNEGVLTANDRLIHLIAGAGVQQNFDTLPAHGGLVATELLLEGTGNFNLLGEGVNQIDTVAGDVNGIVAFINSQALTIGSVTDLLANTTDGVTAETLLVLAEAGDLTVNQTATATTGNLGLFTDDGGIVINAAVVGAALIDIEQIGAVGDIEFTVNGSAAADGDISLIAANNIVMADGATATAVGNGRVEAGGDVTLGGVSADSLRN